MSVRRATAVVTIALLWASVPTLAQQGGRSPGSGDAWLYYVDEDGDVVFTNTPSRPDARVLPGYGDRVRAAFARGLPNTPWDRTIAVVARRYGLTPGLVKAVAIVESGLDPSAVSHKGAIGLMQLMPATAAELGVDDPFDPDANLDGGARYLRSLLDRFGNDLDLALAAYNAGQGTVARYGGVPEYPETQAYLERVRDTLEGAGVRRPVRPARSPEVATDAGGIRAERLPDGTVRYSN